MWTLPLPGGHTPLLDTEGLIETRHDDLDDRLSALREHAGTPVADVCDAVLGFDPQPGPIAAPHVERDNRRSGASFESVYDRRVTLDKLSKVCHGRPGQSS